MLWETTTRTTKKRYRSLTQKWLIIIAYLKCVANRGLPGGPWPKRIQMLQIQVCAYSEGIYISQGESITNWRQSWWRGGQSVAGPSSGSAVLQRLYWSVLYFLMLPMPLESIRHMNHSVHLQSTSNPPFAAVKRIQNQRIFKDFLWFLVILRRRIAD